MFTPPEPYFPDENEEDAFGDPFFEDPYFDYPTHDEEYH